MIRALLVVAAAAATCAGGAAGAKTGAGRIVFSADDAPQARGEVVRLDANGKRIDLSNSPFSDTQPDVAPAGGRVAFVSDRGGARAVYTVRLDGSGLRRVTGYVRSDIEQISTAWSPDGAALAVATVGGLAQTGTLSVATGGRARAVARLVGAESLSWTPDGRFVTVLDGASLDAISPLDGRRAWSAAIRAASTGWTPAGLFAGGDGNGRVLVVDEAGHTVLRFPGTSPAFSQDGALLAYLRGSSLVIRAATGRLVHTLRVPRSVVGFTWTGPRTVFVPTATAALVVDARTGHARPAPYAYPVVLRTNGYSARAVGTRGGFVVRVTGPDGGERTLGRVPACRDDGALVAAVDGLQPTADGRSVVYATNCQEPYSNLYAVAPGGGTPKRLTDAPREQVSPALSPDGTRLAYIQSPFTGLSCKGCPATLWVANADGSDPVELTHLPYCMFDASPSWSPDGTRIVFSRSGCLDSEPPRLDTIAPDGGAVAELGVAGVSVAWGPERIAYLATGTAGLWTALPDGTGAEHVTGGRNASAFSWSPDGRLAFAIREDDGRIRIGIFDGSQTTWLATPFVGLSSLAWSPDGTQLAVAARPKGGATFDVFTLRENGTGVRRVTTDADATSVSWR